jgi:carboxyl-terminal processing protease
MTTQSRERSRLLPRVAAVLVLVVLWGFAASDRAPAGLSAAAQAAEVDSTREARRDKSDHDLSALRIFNRVVLLIKDNYVDPKRIEPRKMLITALDNVERQVAEVMVDGDERSPKIRVTVNKASKDFDISGVDTFWRMSFALKEIFDFVGKNLSPGSVEDGRDVEYAAVNGMLSTLDPHSILLKPEYFKEMKLQTKGEFGGLGFVIQMKESNLTVVRVLKGTPAQRAGIKSKDQIVRIGGESTVNMDLNEAVSRLRGKPGSEVAITVHRPTWSAPKPMTLTRAIINVESVESKLLDKGIGYIKLKGFQGNTSRDLHAALKRLKQDGATRDGRLKGLVLDMRGNPGGLLEQAIQVSDAFVSEGTLVTTVGYSDKLREVKKAHAEDTESELPIVVIVNSGSASASEIVAGALKNLNRALVIGRSTFGKGSVQVLYDFPDDSALKLTIAQYLTPGDISIQEVGITPDIELVPSRVTKDRVDVFAPKKQLGEADLDKHFGNPSSDKVATKRDEVVRREKPLEELRFLRDEPPEKKKDEAAEVRRNPRDRGDRDDFEVEDAEGEDPDTDEIVEDYQMRFARDLLAAAPFSKRDQMLKAAKPFIAERRKLEEERIKKAIEALGLDWSLPDGRVAAAPKLVADMKPSPLQKTVAGDTLAWTVTAQNEGSATFKRLRAYSESDDPYLDRREFLFGTVGPGEKKSWTVNVKLPKEMLSRRDAVTLKFFDEGRARLDDLKGEISIVELPRPAFAYSWQVIDKCDRCNGDGIAQPGETVELSVEVKNIGIGKTHDAIASLKNKADENISLTKGRAKLGELAPGQNRTGVFEFEVKPEFKGATAQLQLVIGDEAVDEFVAEKIDVPVLPKGEAAGRAGFAAVKTSADVPVKSAASEASGTIAIARRGSILPVEARFGDFLKVRFGGRPGYLALRDVKDSKVLEAKGSQIDPVEMRTEPKIQLAGIDPERGGIVTDSERFTLSGTATDPDALRDVYIFVNEQKVFFKSGGGGEDGPGQIRFNTEFALKPGNNNVVVVAREGQDFMARKMFVIHRRSGGAAELAQKAARRVPEIPATP